MRIAAGCVLSVALLALLGGCGLFMRKPAAPVRASAVTPFSIGMPGMAWPGTWHTEVIARLRKPSQYRLVEDHGTTVVEGIAHASASGLVQFLDIDPFQRPMLVWRWKLIEAPAGADNTRRIGEDAALRVIVSFSGDVQKLPFSERLFFEQAKAIAGFDVPYATLEYVWGNGAPKETVIVNSYTSRIRLLLVESGPHPLGEWVSETRDVVADFRRAFGEDPGRITAIAVYTDGDATGADAQGRYGDIAFLRRDEVRHSEPLAAPP